MSTRNFFGFPLSQLSSASTAPTSNQSFGPSTYESGANDDPDFFDVDEYLGTPKDLKRSMQMVGQFPGICEKGLYYSCLGMYMFHSKPQANQLIASPS